MKKAVPIGISLLMVFAVTTVLFSLKIAAGGTTKHLIFAYLLPTAFVAVLYGSVEATLFAIIATACSAYFLYDPTYSFYISNPLEFGELVIFAGLALLATKCVAELRRPIDKRGPARSRR